MTTDHVDVLIVGAGLSGIGAAVPPAGRTARARPTRSSRRATRSAAPGTSSATRASARTRTCTRSATRSGRGRRRRRSPTARRSSTTSATPPREHGIERAHPLRPPGRPRRVVERRRPLDRRGRAHRHRRDGARSPAASSSRARATTTTTRATRPSSPGVERFSGHVVHPQHWPEDLDYAGKRVVVIGSGATAVTLVPAMARDGRARDDAPALADLHASPCPARTRSPTSSAACCRRRPPTPIVRWKNVAADDGSSSSSAAARPKLDQEASSREGVERQLPDGLRRRHALQADATTRGTSASASCPTATCSRRCASGDASIVTDHIETFTETGIKLESGAGARGRHHRHRDRA